jgi:hypothetical protein
MILIDERSYDLLNREKYQNLFNFIQHKYLRKIAGIYLKKIIYFLFVNYLWLNEIKDQTVK